MTVAELARYLHVSRNTIYYWNNCNPQGFPVAKIKSLKRGRYVFDKKKIDQWIFRMKCQRQIHRRRLVVPF